MNVGNSKSCFRNYDKINYFYTVISGLITVYNEDVRKLVSDLTSAFLKAGIEFEIIALDDGSSAYYQEINKTIEDDQKIRYVILPKNGGRSFVRNALAQMAKYPYLLYLDGDSLLLNSDFVLNYLPFLDPAIVYSGGRAYNESPPENYNYLLHWKYGTRVESKSSEIRNLNPYLSFHSNNFLVPKVIIQQFPFDQSLHKYGHEDTLWARLLLQNRINICHMDNPVIHNGLEESIVFLSKSNQAISNLQYLKKIGQGIGTPLEKMIVRLEHFKLDRVYLFLYSICERMITKNLIGRDPLLFFLQLMKIGVYIRHNRHK